MASLECSTESVANWSVRFIMEVVYRLQFHFRHIADVSQLMASLYKLSR